MSWRGWGWGCLTNNLTQPPIPARGSSGTTTRPIFFLPNPLLLLSSSLNYQAGELGTASTPLSPSAHTPSHSSPTKSPFQMSPACLPPLCVGQFPSCPEDIAGLWQFSD